MSDRRTIDPDTHPDPLETYGQPWSHGVLPSGSPLYVSGQTPVDERGEVVHHGDMRRQFDHVLENLLGVVAAAGGVPSDLTELTIYVVDMDRWHDEDVSEVRFDYLVEPYPCSTLVEVDALVHEAMLVEVSAVAHVDDAWTDRDRTARQTDQ